MRVGQDLPRHAARKTRVQKSHKSLKPILYRQRDPGETRRLNGDGRVVGARRRRIGASHHQSTSSGADEWTSRRRKSPQAAGRIGALRSQVRSTSYVRQEANPEMGESP